jgi:hypothetical protein
MRVDDQVEIQLPALGVEHLLPRRVAPSSTRASLTVVSRLRCSSTQNSRFGLRPVGKMSRSPTLFVCRRGGIALSSACRSARCSASRCCRSARLYRASVTSRKAPKRAHQQRLTIGSQNRQHRRRRRTTTGRRLTSGTRAGAASRGLCLPNHPGSEKPNRTRRLLPVSVCLFSSAAIPSPLCLVCLIRHGSDWAILEEARGASEGRRKPEAPARGPCGKLSLAPRASWIASERSRPLSPRSLLSPVRKGGRCR